jgi:hypothetical protein
MKYLLIAVVLFMYRNAFQSFVTNLEMVYDPAYKELANCLLA